jgi:hypothetical protein
MPETIETIHGTSGFILYSESEMIRYNLGYALFNLRITTVLSAISGLNREAPM